MMSEMSEREALTGAVAIIEELSRLYREHQVIIKEEIDLIGISEDKAIGKYLNGEWLPDRLRKSMIYLEAYSELINIGMKETERTIYE